MTKYLIILLLPLLSVNVRAQRKVVFIIVDGIPADVMEKLKPPVMYNIAGPSGYTRAYVGGAKGGYSQSPTISAVGYNHVLTGTWTNKHNVWDNDIKEPNYRYQNVFRIAAETKPGVTTAIFSTWLDNRTKLAGDGLAAAGNIRITWAFDGYEHDTVRFPHGKDRKFISDIDERVATEAAHTIASKAPDLSWVYLEFTDDMGHAFGDSPRFYDAIIATDTRIGKIWNAVKEREQQTGEEWLVIITTDHGRSARDGKDHGGQSDRERTTWIITNAKNTNDHFKTNAAAVDLAPTILRHLNINVPDDVKSEMDGIPLIGNVAFDNLTATRRGKDITLSWTDLKGGSPTADVYVATENNFRTGGRDSYRKVATVPLSAGKASFKAPAGEATKKRRKDRILKILMKTPDNWCNTWLTE